MPDPVAKDPNAPTLWSQSPHRPLLWLMLIAVGSILTQGYVVGIINHGLQVPLMRHFALDPAFDRDPFILEMAHTYTTAFYPAMGALAQTIPLPVLMFVVFVFLRLCTVGLAYLLGVALFQDGVAALWSAVLLSTQTPTFSWDIVSDIYLTHGAMAQVMTLLALLYLARGRVVAAFITAGILFNVHGMHASHLMLIFGVALLPNIRDPRTFRQLALGSALAMAFSLPTLWWMKSVGAMGGVAPEGYAQALHDWYPSHIWPSSWGVLDWSLLFFPIVAAWPLYRLAQPFAPTGQARLVARVAWVAMVLAILGGIVAEVAPIPTLIRFIPMRMSWIMALAGAPFMARAATQLIRSLDRPDLPDARISAALGVMLLMGVCTATLYRNAYWLTVSPALWMVLEYRMGRRVGHYALLMGLLTVFVPAALAIGGAREFPGATGDTAPRNFFIMEGLVTAFASTTILAAFLRRAEGPHKGFSRRVLIQSACLLAAFHLAGRGALVVAGQRKGMMAEWRQTQEWCAQNLPSGQVLMVPLTQMGLRVWSNQVPAVDFQDGDALFHHPQAMEGFIHKLKLYGWEPGEIVGFSHFTRLEPLDERLKTEDALRLGQELGAKVAIRRATQPPWDLPEMYRNASFVIYKLERPGT